MGSFNTSCFVSRQTIAPNDPVVIIPIAQQKSFNPITFSHNEKTFQQFSFANSGCYPTRFWQPVGPFFHATYDDYGRVAIANTPLNLYKLLIFIQSSCEHLPVISSGTNRHHDLPLNLPAYLSEKTPELLAFLQTATSFYAPPPFLFDQALSCWHYIYNAAQSYRTFWFDHSGIPSPLSFSICHLSAYNELINLTNQSSSRAGKPNAMRSRFDQLIVPLQNILSYHHKNPSPFPDDHLVFKATRSLEKLFNFANFEGSSYPGESSALHDILTLCYSSPLSNDYLFDLIKPWLEPHYASSALSLLNLHFEPIVYASQDYSNEIGSAYASFVSKVSSNINTERKISRYGLPFTYSLLIASDPLPSILHSIHSEISNADGYFDLLSSLPHPTTPNITTLTFNTPLGFTDLQDFLEELAHDLNNFDIPTDPTPESPYPHSLASLTQLTNTSPMTT